MSQLDYHSLLYTRYPVLMAGRANSIESHPQREKIINALSNGSTLSQIAAWAEPKVTESAICRWRRNITLRTAAAVSDVQRAIANKDNRLQPNLQDIAMKTAMVVAIDPFVLRATQSDARRDRWMQAAETGKSPDYRVLAALDRNDLTSQEYQARLAHRLTTGDTNTLNVAIVLPGATDTAPEPSWGDGAIDVK